MYILMYLCIYKYISTRTVSREGNPNYFCCTAKLSQILHTGPLIFNLLPMRIVAYWPFKDGSDSAEGEFGSRHLNWAFTVLFRFDSP